MGILGHVVKAIPEAGMLHRGGPERTAWIVHQASKVGQSPQDVSRNFWHVAPSHRTRLSSTSGVGLKSWTSAQAAIVLGGLALGHGRRRCAAAAHCISKETQTPRLVTDGDTVCVHYVGKLEDGTIFDSSRNRDPVRISIGKQMLPGFDDAVRGLSVGDKTSIKLSPEQAYGERNEQLVITFDASQAPEGIQIGDSVRLGSGGRQVPATVVKIADDGAVTVDANTPLAGKALAFDIEVVKFWQFTAPTEAPNGLALATFAAGCFWGVELAFQRLPGVISTSVGYAQGHMDRPTYEDVCTASTGHTEAVLITYDPQVISYEELLETLWERVGGNATTLNVAGGDRGPQYRSGIYFHSEQQRQLAKASIKSKAKELGEPVVTEVEAASTFWFAEDDHQQYLEKGGRNGQPQSALKGCTDTIRCYG